MSDLRPTGAPVTIGGQEYNILFTIGAIEAIQETCNKDVYKRQYMDMAKWKACQVDKIPIDTHGMSVYVGFDMSAKIDLTSVTFVIPFLSGEFDQTGKEIVKYILYSHSFIPNREKLAERKAKDKVDYDAWERMGFITVTDTPIVDQNAVMQMCIRDSS